MLRGRAQTQHVSRRRFVEQGHRAIKGIINPMMGFKDFRRVCIILSGIDVMNMIRKG
ncbi:DDE-type integrase/transposase/recombinase [Paraburkholderia sediminicola]